MSRYSLSYKYISPYIIEISWPAEIQEDILLDMMRMKEKLSKEWGELLWDIIPGFHHLSLHFKSPIQVDEILSELEDFHQKAETQKQISRRRWHIPVYYNGKDMGRVSKFTGKSPQSIIQLHQDKSYLLHFFGFMPGFMYLGGLDAAIHCPRKEKPDPLIEKGSVAIGGKQTGVYPIDSPGGWNVIGKTPIPLFDLQGDSPVFAQPGDQIKFFPIDHKEFETMAEKVKRNAFKLKHEAIQS